MAESQSSSGSLGSHTSTKRQQAGRRQRAKLWGNTFKGLPWAYRQIFFDMRTEGDAFCAQKVGVVRHRQVNNLKYVPPKFGNVLCKKHGENHLPKEMSSIRKCPGSIDTVSRARLDTRLGKGRRAAGQSRLFERSLQTPLFRTTTRRTPQTPPTCTRHAP